MLVQNKMTNNHYIPQLYKKDPLYRAPLASAKIEHHLSLFETHLKQAVDSIPKTKKYNLSHEQRQIIYTLQNNPNFIIMPSDKNLGPAIMNRPDYIKQALTEHLLTDAYQNLKTEDAHEKTKHTRNLLKSLYRKNKTILSKPEQLFFERSFMSQHRLPMFYLIPKVHKTPLKFRPVVSCVNSFNAIFSTWLDHQMKKLLPLIPSYLRDSNQLLDEIKQLPHLPPNARLFTADATAMYTNITTSTAIEAFESLFNDNSDQIPSNFPRTFFLQVLEIIMNRNIFAFDNTFWLQLHGTAMGTPAACLYATISFGIHEKLKILPRFKQNLLYFKRYIDDIFGIWLPIPNTNDDTEWNNFKNELNNWGNLKWVVNDRSTTANFLDLTLTIENHQITTKTFQKDMNLHLYIPQNSAHPTSCLKGLIVGTFLRFRKQNNDQDFSKLIFNFANHLYARGHSLDSIKFHFLRAANLLDNKHLLTRKPNNETTENENNQKEKENDPIIATIKNRPLYLHWQHHPNGIEKQQLRTIFNNTLRDHIPFTKRMIIATSRPKNLRDTLTRTVLQQPQSQQASDYLNQLKNTSETRLL